MPLEDKTYSVFICHDCNHEISEDYFWNPFLQFAHNTVRYMVDYQTLDVLHVAYLHGKSPERQFERII